MTVQGTREAIAAELRETLRPDTIHTMRVRLERTALARYCHWRCAGLIAPLRETGQATGPEV
jgi:hypothetical protein